MRKSLTTLCLLLSLAALAGSADTVAKLRISGYCTYSVPIGKFASQSGAQFITGLSAPAIGGGVSAAYFITPAFTIGLNVFSAAYPLNKDHVDAQLYDRYKRIGYYTTIHINHYDLEITSVSITGSYILNTRFVCIEPYLQIGIASISTGNFNSTYYVKRKKMNEHYYENITPSVSAGNFFYPGIGIQLSTRIYRSLFFDAAAQYNYGELRYKLSEETYDFYGNKSTTSQPITQTVSALNINAGISIRVNKKYISNFLTLKKQHPAENLRRR